MALTADQILAADDMGLKEVNVPEWGGSVYIRVMTVGERDEYERMADVEDRHWWYRSTRELLAQVLAPHLRAGVRPSERGGT